MKVYVLLTEHDGGNHIDVEVFEHEEDAFAAALCNAQENWDDGDIWKQQQTKRPEHYSELEDYEQRAGDIEHFVLEREVQE
jgi:hypothetical protein